MLRLAFIPFIALLIWLAATPSAQATNAGELSLTLGNAVQLALHNNPDLALVSNAKQAADIDLKKAQGNYLPTLQASGQASQNWQQQSSPGVDHQSQELNLNLAANLNLFNGFADQAGVSAAEELSGAATQTLNRQQQTTAFDTLTNCVSLLVDRELVQVRKSALESEQQLQQQIEAFYQAGTRSVTDLYRQQAATSQAEYDLLETRRNQQVAELALLQQLGMEPPVTVVLQAPNRFELLSREQTLDLPASYRLALQSRPDLLAQEKQLTARRHQVRQARAGYLPSVDLYATTGTGYSSLDEDNAFGSQLAEKNGSATVGLSVTIPIFDGDQTRTSVALARISQSDASLELTKLRQQIGSEVGQGLADLQTARQQAQVAASQLTYARQAWEAAQARYQVGSATWVELSDARTTLVEAQTAEVEARYAVLQQSLTVGYARGDLQQMLALLTQEEAP